MATPANHSAQIQQRAQRAEEYLEADHSLAGQEGWYDAKAGHSKKWHMRLGLIIIAAGAAVSLVQLWAPDPPDTPVHWTVWVTATLGAIVVVAKGIDRLWSFDENWATYRQAAEAIKRERRLYVNAAGPYTGFEDERAFHLFVARVEDVIAAEGGAFWKLPASAEPEGEKAP